uniref:Protein kinase domain-containing protein n=1 Tax=Meloidogyne hapla TaxID=6305 RepID=A0A1I8BR75_MELHA
MQNFQFLNALLLIIYLKGSLAGSCSSKEDDIVVDVASSSNTPSNRLINGSVIQINKELGKVQVIEYIASGTHADVYKALLLTGRNEVALKVITLRDDGTREREIEKAKKEVKMLYEFANKYANRIIQIYGDNLKTYKQNQIFIVLELGEKNLLDYYNQIILQREIASGISLTTEEKGNILNEILIEAAEALKQFHQYGIHFDIKPGNFVVSNENEQIKLVDLGTSFWGTQIYIKGPASVGTNLYTAPELKNASHGTLVTKKADIYSFGVMMYKLKYSPRELIGNFDRSHLDKNNRLDNIIQVVKIFFAVK